MFKGLKRVLISALPVWMLLLSAPGLRAQSTNGTLTGTVDDASGAVIPGASITLKNVNSGDERRTVTNNDGFFSINAVPPGDYTVLIEAKGFQKLERSGVHFDSGDRRNLSNLALQVGTSTETVVVSAAAESITPVDSGEKSVLHQLQADAERANPGPERRRVHQNSPRLFPNRLADALRL